MSLPGSLPGSGRSSASASDAEGEDDDPSERECERECERERRWPVTAAWLERVLAPLHPGPAGAGGVRVLDFSVRPGCDAGESVLSDIVAVGVDYSAQGLQPPQRAELIVKLLPHDPFSRFFVTEAQFDLREIKFYTQVVPELEAFERERLGAGAAVAPLPIPRCLHAHYADPEGDGGGGAEGQESVLVLENLKARGFRGADLARGLSLRQATAALRALARLHALSLAAKLCHAERPLPQRYPFLFQTARATHSYQQLVERGLPQLASFLERRPASAPVLHALAALRPRTKEIIAALLAPEEPLALVTHTDFWCNNLLFKEEEGEEGDEDEEGEGQCECAVLDWQMVTYSRPSNDVALLLLSSLSPELRRRRGDALVRGYWAALGAACEALGVAAERVALGAEARRRDHRRSLLLALLLCVGSVDVALGDPRTEQRLLAALHDLHADGVLDPALALPDA